MILFTSFVILLSTSSDEETMMKSAIFTALLLVGLTSSAPTFNSKLVITEEFLQENFKIYQGQHDIIKIFLPANAINFGDDSSSEKREDVDAVIFFVEADVKDGVNTDQGLYVRRERKIKKLLDNGRDIDAAQGDFKSAYFATKDGLYSYNYEKNEAEKYGDVNDDLKALAIGNSSATIYVLTTDKTVYKVTEEGNKKVKVDEVKNAEQIVMDFNNNLFYVDTENKIYVVSDGGVKRIEGLPESPSKVTLVRPTFVANDRVYIVADNIAYEVFANDTIDPDTIEIRVPITAYSIEGALIQYYAHDKKIYEYNILTLILGDILKEVKDFLDSMKNDIKNIASRTRSDITNSLF